MKDEEFQTVLLAVIYDPKEKKILIGRRENDPHLEELKWCFPGGKPNHNQELETALSEKIKLKTGYEISNLGSIFIRIAPEKRDQILIYYLCEALEGTPTPGDDLVELKWVAPKELEKHFTTSFHPNLKEYVMNLK